MKLSDLKTGMVVETINGNKYLVVNDYFIRNDGCMRFSTYDEDMTEMSNPEYDVVKVWTQKGLNSINCMLTTDWLSENRFGHLIWDRSKEEVVDMTLEEVCQVLGKNVRIVKEK